MFNYIKADLYRIANKRSNYFFYLTLAGLFAVLLVVFYGPAGAYFNSSYSMNTLSSVYYELGIFGVMLGGSMVIGAQSYHTVYLDDFSTNNLSNIFTAGLKKYEYLLSKIIVQAVHLFVVLVLAAALFVGGYFILQTTVDNPGFKQVDLITFLQSVVVLYVSLLAFSMIAHIAGVIMQRSDISIVLFFILVNGLLAQIVGMLSNINGLEFLGTVEEYSLSTVQTSAMQGGILSILEGSIGTEGMYQAIYISLAYLLVSFLINWVLFTRVEIKE